MILEPAPVNKPEEVFRPVENDQMVQVLMIPIIGTLMALSILAVEIMSVRYLEHSEISNECSGHKMVYRRFYSRSSRCKEIKTGLGSNIRSIFGRERRWSV